MCSYRRLTSGPVGEEGGVHWVRHRMGSSSDQNGPGSCTQLCTPTVLDKKEKEFPTVSARRPLSAECQPGSGAAEEEGVFKILKAHAFHKDNFI